VAPAAQPAAVPLNNPATTIAPPVTPQHVAKPAPICSVSSLGAQIATDGFSQAAVMSVAIKSLREHWLELKRDYVNSIGPLSAHKLYKLCVSTTNQVRQDACALRDRIFPLAGDLSPGQGAAGWLPTLVQLDQVIAAADSLLEKYQELIDYSARPDAIIYPPTEMLGSLVVADIDQLEQAASKLSDTIQRKILAEPRL
jgi:hypothetical protein